MKTDTASLQWQNVRIAAGAHDYDRRDIAHALKFADRNLLAVAGLALTSARYTQAPTTSISLLAPQTIRNWLEFFRVVPWEQSFWQLKIGYEAESVFRTVPVAFIASIGESDIDAALRVIEPRRALYAGAETHGELCLFTETGIVDRFGAFNPADAEAYFTSILPVGSRYEGVSFAPDTVAGRRALDLTMQLEKFDAIVYQQRKFTRVLLRFLGGQKQALRKV